MVACPAWFCWYVTEHDSWAPFPPGSVQVSPLKFPVPALSVPVPLVRLNAIVPVGRLAPPAFLTVAVQVICAPVSGVVVVQLKVRVADTDGVAVAVRVTVGGLVGVSVTCGVSVGVLVIVGVFVTVAVLVAVGVSVGVFETSGVAVGVGVSVGGSGVLVRVGVAVLVGVFVIVGVAVGTTTFSGVELVLGAKLLSPA